MRLGTVKHVVHPVWTLLYSEIPPFRFRHQMCPWGQFRQVVGQDHVAIFIKVVRILFRILDVFHWHVGMIYKSI